ncbi:MAG: diphthamide biosynthesis enzyme Dph2 [Promethearchaeota archaeon]
MKKFQCKNYTQALNLIRSENYNRILLQCPAGLLNKELLAFVSEIQEDSRDVIIVGEECYGACDLPLSYAFELQVDVIIHVGHSIYHQLPLITDLIYVTIEVEIDLSQYADEIYELCKMNSWNSLTLVGTIQHTSSFLDLATKLQQDQIDVLIPSKRGHLQEGQILGCEVNLESEKTTDAILCVAGGRFHALAVMLSQKNPTISLDPFLGTIDLYTTKQRNKYLMKRYALIEKSRHAKVWGVIYGLKSGQKRPYLMTLAKQWIKGMNKTSITIAATQINPHSLNNFSFVDAWVTTHCIRQGLDDNELFTKPSLTIAELGVACGKIAWKTLIEGDYLNANHYPQKHLKNDN